MINFDSHKNSTLTKKNKSKIDKLSILSLNCRSVRSQSRRALLQSIMEEHQADIVIGCESHLDNSFSSQEIFPLQYVTQHEKIGLMCTKYSPSHYSTYLRFFVRYTSSVNCIIFAMDCCTSCKSFINKVCLDTKL